MHAFYERISAGERVTGLALLPVRVTNIELSWSSLLMFILQV